MQRLGGFVEALEKRERSPEEQRIRIQKGDCIEFDNVTVKSPDERLTLVENLSFKLRDDQSLMIVGPSGYWKNHNPARALWSVRSWCRSGDAAGRSR